MSEKPSKEDLEKQIRFHEGQAEWTRWSMRAERLDELVEMFESWVEREEVTKVCVTLPSALDGLRKAQDAARAKLGSLDEFAFKPKRGKKKEQA